MSSGYNERGYGPQQGYPGQGPGPGPGQGPVQGYAPQQGVGVPRAQGHAAPPKSGPSSTLIYVLLAITALNLLLTGYLAYQTYAAASAASAYLDELSGSLGDLEGSLGG